MKRQNNVKNGEIYYQRATSQKKIRNKYMKGF